MADLAAQLGDRPVVRGRAPWPDHEYVKGWDASGCTSIRATCWPCACSPRTTLLRIARCGTATRLVAGRSTSTARSSTPPARYYGAACDYTGFAHIDLAWTGARSLRVVLAAPSLEWTLTAAETPALQLLNTISAALPISTWRPRPLVRSRELLTHALGMGDMRLTGVMPSGHIGTLMPQQMFFIEHATAVLDGVDLGRPAHLRENPRIGQIPLPTRGVLGIGQAVRQTLDPAEYERTRAETAPLA